MATRFCPNCNGERQWMRVRPPGAHRSRFACFDCGGNTRRIKGRRKKDTMPKGLYNYRMKVKVANDLWRHLIYKKAKDGACANCGTKKGLQAMHLFPKGGLYAHMRFELDNGAPGCAGCHRRMTNDHELHRQFCIRYLGEERYERLRLMSISRSKIDIDLIILYLQRLTNASGVPEGQVRLHDEKAGG
jgi:hypothetical protein